MKEFKYLFLLIAISIMGCSDLEEEPKGALTPESFFTSVADVQTAVNGCYGHFIHENFWGRKFPLTLLLRSDMVAIGDLGTASRRIEHEEFNVLTDNGMIEVYWPRAYQVIGAANTAIAGAESITADEEVINPVIAQAYFCRAFMYFHLVRQFGAIPYLDAPVTDIQVGKSISSTPVDEVYANIIADLEYAKTWLPATQEARSIPAKSAASSYLALVHLTLGDWQSAYDEAKEVIDNEANYDLALDSDYQNLFNATTIDASKEPIFALDFNGYRDVPDDGNAGNDQMGPITGIRADNQYGHSGGWSVAVPSMKVFETWDGRDYRKKVSFDTTGVFNIDGVLETRPYTEFLDFHSKNVNRPYMAKYTRYPGNYANGNGRATSYNYSMIRYAEVLLIAAEAANEIGDPDGNAHDLVNRVRARARLGGVSNGFTASDFPADVAGLSQADFRTMVLEERRLELCFEAKRWYDIARRKMASEVFSASGLEGEKPGFDPNVDYLLPIPADELTRNPNLTPTPGYSY